MSLSTRTSLIRLARKYDALIVTDDVYDFLQWPTDSAVSPSTLTHAVLPRLVDIDRTLSPIPSPSSFGNAVSNGSFSKIAGPGVRTGWADASPTFSFGLSQCGASRSGGAPSQMTATFMDSLLRSGDLRAHIEGVLKPAYQRRYCIMLDAIKKYLLPLGVSMLERSLTGKDISGGYFIWIDLPDGVIAEVVSERCKEKEGLIVAPGRLFEVSGDESIKFPRSLRLCLAWCEEDELDEGVRKLGKIVREVLDGEGASGDSSGKGTERDFGEFK